MNLFNISFAIFVVVISLFGMLRIRILHQAKAFSPGYASQRMCRACGSITPRSTAICVQCGKPLPAIQS
jgi:hypothetical protein